MSVDAYQRLFWKLGVAIALLASWIIFTGDVDQTKDTGGARRSQTDVQGSVQINIALWEDDPFRIPFNMLPK